MLLRLTRAQYTIASRPKTRLPRNSASKVLSTISFTQSAKSLAMLSEFTDTAQLAERNDTGLQIVLYGVVRENTTDKATAVGNNDALGWKTRAYATSSQLRLLRSASTCRKRYSPIPRPTFAARRHHPKLCRW